MIEPHMQAMATALLRLSNNYESVAISCVDKGHYVSAKILCDIFDRLDNVWTKYDATYQKFKQQFLHAIECDDE